MGIKGKGIGSLINRAKRYLKGASNSTKTPKLTAMQKFKAGKARSAKLKAERAKKAASAKKGAETRAKNKLKKAEAVERSDKLKRMRKARNATKLTKGKTSRKARKLTPTAKPGFLKSTTPPKSTAGKLPKPKKGPSETFRGLDKKTTTLGQLNKLKPRGPVKPKVTTTAKPKTTTTAKPKVARKKSPIRQVSNTKKPIKHATRTKRVLTPAQKARVAAQRKRSNEALGKRKSRTTAANKARGRELAGRAAPGAILASLPREKPKAVSPTVTRPRAATTPRKAGTYKADTRKKGALRDTRGEVVRSGSGNVVSTTGMDSVTKAANAKLEAMAKARNTRKKTRKRLTPAERQAAVAAKRKARATLGKSKTKRGYAKGGLVKPRSKGYV